MWGKDPQVNIRADGLKGSLFDQVEDMDSKQCMKVLMNINKINEPAPKPPVTKSSSSKKTSAAPPPSSKKTESSNGGSNAIIGLLVIVGLTLLAGGKKPAPAVDKKNAKNGKK